MSIEHFRFMVCDECGVRFRTDRPGVVLGARVLCDQCSGLAVVEADAAEAGAPVTEEQIFRELDEGSRSPRAPLPPRPELPPLPAAAAPPTGDERALEPIGPMPELSVDLPRRRRRRRRKMRQRKREWWSGEVVGGRGRGRRSRRRRWRWRWPRRVALAVLLVAVVAGGTWQLQELGRRLARSRPPEVTPSLRGPIRALPDLLAAQELAGRFLAASSAAEAASLVRPWAGVDEALERFFAAWQPLADPATALSPMPPEIEGGLAYQVFGLILPDGKGRLLPVVPTAAGPKVDFKAFSEWSNVAPAGLLDGRVSEAAELRAMLRPSTYYNFRFADSDRFQAYDATVAGMDETLVFYAERGSDEERRISEALNRVGMHPVTVAVRPLDDSFRHQQFLITRLLAVGFVVPDAAAGNSG